MRREGVERMVHNCNKCPQHFVVGGDVWFNCVKCGTRTFKTSGDPNMLCFTCRGGFKNVFRLLLKPTRPSQDEGT